MNGLFLVTLKEEGFLANQMNLLLIRLSLLFHKVLKLSYVLVNPLKRNKQVRHLKFVTGN